MGSIFKKKQTVNDFRNKCNTKGYELYIFIKMLVSAIYTFSLAGNLIFQTPIRGTKMGKSTLMISLIKEKLPILAGNTHLSVLFFLHGLRLFHISTEK